mmetsp:Transcript_689/g.928  ORF Transcript_689/g.928 Transcript_689/m.928 type:complete len:86 (+) Transcript_689:50-307(+)
MVSTRAQIKSGSMDLEKIKLDSALIIIQRRPAAQSFIMCHHLCPTRRVDPSQSRNLKADYWGLYMPRMFDKSSLLVKLHCKDSCC